MTFLFKLKNLGKGFKAYYLLFKIQQKFKFFKSMEVLTLQELVKKPD